MITRRGLLEAAGVAVAFGGGGALVTPGQRCLARRHASLAFALASCWHPRRSGFRNSCRQKTTDPTDREAPITRRRSANLRTAITPNDEFFVRYHLASIPQVDASTWTLSIGAEGADRAVTLNLDALKKLPAFEGDGRLSMRGQSPRPVSAACRWGSMGLWRDGLRAMEWRPP